MIAEEDVDLGFLPIQTCWPGDAGPLVTRPLVITRGPEKDRQNLGIYRMQKIGPNKLIMRWLSHRVERWTLKSGKTNSRARAFRIDCHRRGSRYCAGDGHACTRHFVRIRICRPAKKQQNRSCKVSDRPTQVPASAEIVLEGVIEADEMADEGPYGDHTGYYNEVERFPVFTIKRITHRRDPIYHSTYTGRPPDEPLCWAWPSMRSSSPCCKSNSQRLSISIYPLRAALIAWQSSV